MSSNAIKRAMSVGTAKLSKTGAEIICEVAVETETWKRTELAAANVGKFFKKAVEEEGANLPAGTVTLISREGNHQSPADQREHFTAEAWDKNGNYLSTVHIVAKK